MGTEGRSITLLPNQEGQGKPQWQQLSGSSQQHRAEAAAGHTGGGTSCHGWQQHERLPPAEQLAGGAPQRVLPGSPASWLLLGCQWCVGACQHRHRGQQRRQRQWMRA